MFRYFKIYKIYPVFFLLALSSCAEPQDWKHVKPPAPKEDSAPSKLSTDPKTNEGPEEPKVPKPPEAHVNIDGHWKWIKNSCWENRFYNSVKTISIAGDSGFVVTTYNWTNKCTFRQEIKLDYKLENGVLITPVGPLIHDPSNPKKCLVMKKLDDFEGYYTVKINNEQLIFELFYKCQHEFAPIP